MAKPSKPFVHPVLMPVREEFIPIAVYTSMLPVTKWRYYEDLFAKGRGNMYFFPDGDHAPPKYQLPLKHGKSEDELRTIGDNMLVMLNLKDGL